MPRRVLELRPSAIATASPWYREHPGPALFNEWTWTHFAWGMLARKYVGLIAALALHTVYEMIEGALFPLPDRDPSMRNHVGDTVALAAGWYVAGGERR
jgi:hypothetical protein